MRHWSQLATRNWRVRRVRTLGAVLAIALGSGTVVWVMCCYESVRRTTLAWASGYVGTSHISVESPLGRHGQLPQRLVGRIRPLAGIRHLAWRLIQQLSARPVRRAALERDPQARLWFSPSPVVSLHGIDLQHEFAVRSYELAAGRLLRPDDRLACVLEADFARDYQVGLGDVLLTWTAQRAAPCELQIVGLLRRRRVTPFQKPLALVRLPVLQQLTGRQALITSIDVVLAQPTRANLRRLAARIRAVAQPICPNVSVRSVEVRMRQIRAAQQQQGFVLALLSCVALLTALFIILSTLSMGMIERVGQLGLLRCAGTGRWQLALLLLVELLPLGLVGVLAGMPIGLGLTWLTARLVPEYVGGVAVNHFGLLLAAGAGLFITLAAALLPALGALRVSPLEAARPRARRPGRTLVVAVFAAGLLLLALQHLLLFPPHDGPAWLLRPLQRFQIQRSPWFTYQAGLAVVLLYLGYGLAAPVAVWLVGSSAVYLVARLVGLRARLLQDQVGHAVWRSAGICCGLMVALSLIIGLVTFNRSLLSSWQFPRKFPEAFIWSFEQMRDDAAGIVAQVPGVGSFSVANAVPAVVRERPGLMQHMYLSMTWFLGADPDTFFDLLRLEFIEGNQPSARRQLKQGGYVLVAEDFSRSRNKHLGDRVRVWIGDRAHTFTIAAVVQSPALEIAAGYFQLQSEANTTASGSVLGTNADLRRYYGISGVNLILLNFNLPPQPAPPGWPPPRTAPAARGLADFFYDQRLPRARRWQRFREQRVTRAIISRLDASQAYGGTARQLKDEIDAELTRITALLTAVPTVALFVAAIGVANLMTANAASRARQFAILRAVGATRGQIVRLVIGEALVLGLLGSALGLALGADLALGTTTMVDRMWGYQLDLTIPWGYVQAAIALTVALCLIAGTAPARHAARTNIVEALHVA